MHSMEADKHRLSGQVCQLQSKIDRAAWHRDLIVGMKPEKGPDIVSDIDYDIGGYHTPI